MCSREARGRRGLGPNDHHVGSVVTSLNAKLHLAKRQPPGDRGPVGGDAVGARGDRATVVVASAGADGRGMVGRRPGRPASPQTITTRLARSTDQTSVLPAAGRAAHATLLVACSKCDWKAAFDRAALIVSHGPDHLLTDLLGELASLTCSKVGLATSSAYQLSRR